METRRARQSPGGGWLRHAAEHRERGVGVVRVPQKRVRARTGHNPRAPPWGTVRTVTRDDLDLDAVRAELTARRDRDRERLGVLAQRPELGSAVGFGKRIGDGTSEA